jgi:hypothetical protein
MSEKDGTVEIDPAIALEEALERHYDEEAKGRQETRK